MHWNVVVSNYVSGLTDLALNYWMAGVELAAFAAVLLCLACDLRGERWIFRSRHTLRIIRN